MQRHSAQDGKVAGASPATRTISGMSTGQANRASVLTSACFRASGASPRYSASARSSKRTVRLISGVALDECLDPERAISVSCGGSPDKRGASPESKCGSPHRECESRSLRHQWKKSGIDEDTALKAAAGRTCRGCDSHFFRHFRGSPGSLCFRRSSYERFVCVL